MMMDEMMDKMDLNLNMESEETVGKAAEESVAEAEVEIAKEIAAETEARTKLDLKDESAVREALEQARAAETRAYHGMKSAAALTGRQKGVLQLAKLEELESPSQEQLDEKCRLILESYYLPHIAKDGFVAKLDPAFTRDEDPGRDYIEAKFTNTSGKTLTVGYNYKTDDDGKDILVFEKSFQNIVLKPGEPEKYALIAPNGKEIESISMEKLEEKLASGEVVKVEQGYFQKAKDEDGIVRKGITTPIVEIESGNGMKMSFGNNEQNKFTIGKNGQLTCATTNDVITANIETRSFSSGPIYDSANAAKVAAQGVIQAGEANPKIEISMEGTTVAEFSYLPTLKTSVELAGLSRKLGKGMEGYDPNDSEGENLRRQFDKPIRDYLNEKGYYVLDVVCENLMADVTENVGFMNTMKTYQMTGGVISVTYIKKHTQFVNIKQGVLGRKQGNNVEAIVAQLPEGSELLNPEEINWKNSKEEVAYVTRRKVTGTGSAKNTNEADDKAAENAIVEAQRIVARSINGSIASGIKEVIAGLGASSTVASVRARLTTGVVSKNDMQLTHKDAKYAYSGTCDRMVTSSENKLVSVTSWSGNLLTYVEAKEPVIDKGIPTDENYDKYINQGDDSGILLFEKTDMGLRRYMKEVLDAQSHTKTYREMYLKARSNLNEIQSVFDRLIDERLGVVAGKNIMPKPEQKEEQSIAESVTEEVIEPVELSVSEETEDSVVEPSVVDMEMAGAAAAVVTEEILDVEPSADDTEESVPAVTEELMPAAEEPIVPEAPIPAPTVAEEPVPAPAVDHKKAQEALLSIFGDMPAEEPVAVAEPVVPEAPAVAEEPVPAAPVFDPFAIPEPAAETAPAVAEEPVSAPIVAEEPVSAPAVDHKSAQEALLSIFGDMPAEEPVAVAEPVVPEAPVVAEEPVPAAPVFDPFAMPEPAPVPAPAVAEEPVSAPTVAEEPVSAPAVDHKSAQEALLSIFGDMPAEEPVAVAEPVVPEAPAVAEEPVSAPIVAEEPVPAPAVDHKSARDALLSIFGDMPTEEPTVAEESIAPEPVSSMPVAPAPVVPAAPTFFEGESDMPVAPRPVTENRYERPEASRAVESNLYVRPMPVLAEGETYVRQDRSEQERPSISLDGTFVVPLPEVPDIQIKRTDNASDSGTQDDGALDAAWEQLMKGMSDDKKQ